ncbi:MAG: tRNA (adenosine(37)-N6)-threonylcarbamoyltransferase complex transferase subunit TsaD [Alphaproteobacteria bacterium]|nr:tRNA (adenosine(37)-N6)-threonylcarbamoyltransferase complex transferase subunit TsaD [Alphaproteobacteria bacterium]
MLVLGIETSCDETAVALVEGNPPGPGRIINEQLYTQLIEHQEFSGVVPEIAARAHLERLDALTRDLFETTSVDWGDIDAIAATAGPGLIGGVLVGLMYAKGLAQARGLPFVAVNHLEAHGLTARLSHGVACPYWLLLVSGGHTQIIQARDVDDFVQIGGTIDDAAGEAFDKVAKMMGLGMPGGPKVENLALNGDPKAFELPRPLLKKPGYDFSFSGLKTAVRRHLESGEIRSEQNMADLAASFQDALGDCLMGKLERALEEHVENISTLVVAGGVARNQYLRTRLEQLAQAHEVSLICPPMSLCSDNAAMIAWAGIEMLSRGHHDALDVPAKSRWPLRSSSKLHT